MNLIQRSSIPNIPGPTLSAKFLLIHIFEFFNPISTNFDISAPFKLSSLYLFSSSSTLWPYLSRLSKTFLTSLCSLNLRTNFFSFDFSPTPFFSLYLPCPISFLYLFIFLILLSLKLTARGFYRKPRDVRHLAVRIWTIFCWVLYMSYF